MTPNQMTSDTLNDRTIFSLVNAVDQAALIDRRRKSALKAMSKGDLRRLVEAMDPFVAEYQEWIKHYATHGSDFGDWLARRHETY